MKSQSIFGYKNNEPKVRL